MRWFLLMPLAFCAACAGAPVSDPVAAAAFDQIENTLMSARVLRVDYEIEARGVLVANLQGDLVIQQPALAAMRAHGEFAGDDLVALLVADGERIRGGVSEFFDEPGPVDLHGGLLVGLTRMGVLHNIARLSQNAPPERTDGSVRDWVQSTSFAGIDAGRKIRGVMVKGISFDIEVNGEPAGKAVLWYEPTTGMPVAREQRVHFDSGDMVVVERYEIEAEGIIGPCRFDTDALD